MMGSEMDVQRYLWVLIAFFLFASGDAWAQSGEVALKVRVGSRATVEKMPRVKAGLAEIVVRDSSVDLNATLSNRNTAYISQMDAMSTGANTWFVRIDLRDRGHDIQADIVDGELVVTVGPAKTGLLSMRERAPSLDQMLSGELPETGEPPVLPPLMFLHNDALSLPLDPYRYQSMLPPTPMSMPRSSWSAIDRARLSMLEAPTRSAATRAQFELAWHYLELGMAREARYYFSKISAKPGPIAQREVALARGWAALGGGRWDEARDQFTEAHRLGASERSIAEGLAMVSLATNNPKPAPMGRLLASVTGRTEALLLAAELMQRDGYFAESRPILEALMSKKSRDGQHQILPLRGENAERGALRLGDARLMDGATDAAMRAWRLSSPDIVDVRVTLLELLEEGPASWAMAIPKLTRLGRDKSAGGAEALYLVAQINMVVGTRQDALTALSSLLRQHNQQAARSDAPSRLWSLYATHVADLHRYQRWFDIAALHEAVWDPSLRKAVKDWQILVNVAFAYEEIGLPGRAIAVLRDAVSMLVENGEYNPEIVLHLAELYLGVDNWKDGLLTLDYLGRLGIPTSLRGEVVMLEARLHEVGGNKNKMAAALRKAALHPDFKTEASLMMAVMDAEEGMCQQSSKALQRILFNPKGARRFSAPRPWLALARCLAVMGDNEGNARAAREAAARTSSPEEARYASWLAAVATNWSDPEELEAIASGDDVWSSIAESKKQDDAFKKGMEKYKKSDWDRRVSGMP